MPSLLTARSSRRAPLEVVSPDGSTEERTGRSGTIEHCVHQRFVTHDEEAVIARRRVLLR